MEDIVQIIIVVGIIIVPLLKKLLETPTDESNGPIEVEEHPAPPSDSVPVTDFVPPLLNLYIPSDTSLPSRNRMKSPLLPKKRR